MVPTTEPYAARFIALCFEKSYASMYMTILGFLQLKTCKNGFSLPYRAKKKHTHSHFQIWQKRIFEENVQNSFSTTVDTLFEREIGQFRTYFFRKSTINQMFLENCVKTRPISLLTWFKDDADKRFLFFRSLEVKSGKIVISCHISINK